MPIDFTVDSLDSIDEQFRPLYKKGDDGKFRLDTKLPDPDPNQIPEAIKSELARARDEAAQGRNFKKQLADLKSSLGEGFDPEEYKALKAKAADEESKRLAAEGDWKSLKDQMEKRHSTELSKAEERAEKYRRQRDKVMMRDAALNEIVKAKGAPRLLLPPVMERLRIVEGEGDADPEVQVVDERGNPMVMNGKGEAYTIAKLIEDFKGNDEFARAFDAAGQSGGGMPPGAPNGRGTNHGLDVKNMSGSEILRKIRNGELPTGMQQARK
jgi:hypothetical protein